MVRSIQLRFAQKFLARSSSQIASSARPTFRRALATPSSVFATSGWDGPSGRSRIAKARRYSGSAFSGCPWTTRSWARFTTLNTTSKWPEPVSARALPSRLRKNYCGTVEIQWPAPLGQQENTAQDTEPPERALIHNRHVGASIGCGPCRDIARRPAAMTMTMTSSVLRVET